MKKFEKGDIIRIVITFVVSTVICWIIGKVVEGFETECVLNELGIPAFVPAIFISLLIVLDTLFKNKKNDVSLNFKKGLIYFGITIVTTLISWVIISAIFAGLHVSDNAVSISWFFGIVLSIVLTILLTLWKYQLKSKEYIILLITTGVVSGMFGYIYAKAIFLFVCFAIVISILVPMLFGEASLPKISFGSNSSYDKGYEEGKHNVGVIRSLMDPEEQRGYDKAREEIEKDKEIRGF